MKKFQIFRKSEAKIASYRPWPFVHFMHYALTQMYIKSQVLIRLHLMRYLLLTWLSEKKLGQVVWLDKNKTWAI